MRRHEDKLKEIEASLKDDGDVPGAAASASEDEERSKPIGKDEVLQELRRWKVEWAAKMLYAEARWEQMERGSSHGEGLRIGQEIGSSSCDRLVIDYDE